MEYDGLVVRYPINRPLTNEELQKRVEVGTPTSFSPADNLTSISKNDLCLELVDKYYAWKGVASGFLVAPLVFFVWLRATFPSAVAAGIAKTADDDKWQGWLVGGFGLVCLSFLVGLLVDAAALAWIFGIPPFAK